MPLPAPPNSHLTRRTLAAGGVTLTLLEDGAAARALRPMAAGGGGAQSDGRGRLWEDGQEGAQEEAQQGARPAPQKQAARRDAALADVGRVAWQAAFVLADLVLRHPPFGQWTGVSVLDLGCGTGALGLLLAAAGAAVTLADVPRLLPLAAANADANAASVTLLDLEWTAGRGRAGVGDPPRQFDVVVAAEVAYEAASLVPLADTAAAAVAPHGVLYAAHRVRGTGEERLAGLLAERGLAVDGVPDAALAPEYRGGHYAVLRAAHLGG